MRLTSLRGGCGDDTPQYHIPMEDRNPWVPRKKART